MKVERVFAGSTLWHYGKMFDKADNEANPYKSPEATEASPLDPRPTHARDKRRVMAWMVALYGVVGWLTYEVGDDPGGERLIRIVTGIAFAVLCLRWCHYDQLERGTAGWRYLAVTMVLCPGPLVVFPIYFLYTRGFQQGMLASLKALGFLAVLIGTYILVALTMSFLTGIA